VGWRLACGGGDRARFTWLRPVDENAARAGSATLLLDPEKRPAFDRPVRGSGYEFWNVSLAPEALKAMLAIPRVRVEENTAMADGTTAKDVLEFDTGGLEDGWKKISASCGTGATVVQSRPYRVTPASPAARVNTTRPEPGSVWPGVTADPPPPENKLNP
jgi:hypothetical protein